MRRTPPSSVRKSWICTLEAIIGGLLRSSKEKSSRKKQSVDVDLYVDLILFTRKFILIFA